MILLYILMILFVAFILFLTFDRINFKKEKFSITDFFGKGFDLGFSMKDLFLLWKVAVNNEIEVPTSLFWSEYNLDRCLRAIMIKMRLNGEEDDPSNNKLLNRLFVIRKKIEFNRPKSRETVDHTSKIHKGQFLKLKPPWGGLYTSEIIENNERNLAISYPSGPPVPSGESWRGHEVEVYFYKKNEASYYYKSSIINDFEDRAQLKMSHSKNLIRSQKRDSMRKKTLIPCQLFIIKYKEELKDEKNDEIGIPCYILDLSEKGFSVLIGGKGKAEIVIKLKFRLGQEELVINGQIRSVSYSREKKQSILHSEIVQVDNSTYNSVMAFVYNIFNTENANLSNNESDIKKQYGLKESRETATDKKVEENIEILEEGD